MKRRHPIVSAIAVIAVAVSVSVSSCSAINVNALPQPGESYSSGYDVVFEFDNVLNLPDRAKVVMGGNEVGVVTGVAVEDRKVDVTVRIDSGVEVPSNIFAALEQATVLGDIYVSLSPPSDGGSAPALAPGATVPLSQTTSPPQLEDTLSHLAFFVTSGSIQRLQNTVVGINRITPAQSRVREIATRVTADLRDLSDNIDVVDHLLGGISDTGGILAGRLSSAEFWFSPRGMRGFEREMVKARYMARLFPSVGSIYSGGYWAAPLLDSLVEATGATARSKWAFEDEWPAWQKLTTDLFLPQDKYPAINITSIVGPDGRELSADALDVLRMLGGTP